MDKLKIVETALLAAGALISAAKWIVKFIGYLRKLLEDKVKQRAEKQLERFANA